MLRSLIWVLLTLPVGVLILLWADSYWHQTAVYWVRGWQSSGVGVDTGLACVWIRPLPDPWRSVPSWHIRERNKAVGRQWISASDSTHGFGFRRDQDGFVMYQVPMWTVTLAAALPPLWFLQRRRECRKVGFPVSPAEKN